LNKEEAMHTLRIVVLFFICLAIAPIHAIAGDFDGSKPLLGAVIEIYECVANTPCEQVTVEDVDFTYFLHMDFKNKKITGTRADGKPLNSKINDIMSVDGMLILQGVENGKGWTLSISETTGKMVLTVSGDEEGFIAFGACTPK